MGFENKLEHMKFSHNNNEKGFAVGMVILDFVQSIVLALSVFVLLYLFVAQPNQVKGTSMLPNFQDQEYLLTDKLTYEFSSPQRGDVIVFRAPPSEPCAEDECEYIKRIIGLPGDKVRVEGGKVYLNEKMLNEPYLALGTVVDQGSFNREGVDEVVPSGQYLAFGDNRQHSRDGREFGPINKDAIVGKAFFVYWPVSQIGLVPKVRL